MNSGIFPVEMESFTFLSQYRDTKAIFYLFYKIIKIFFECLRRDLCISTLIQNENDVSVSLYSKRKGGSSH